MICLIFLYNIFSIINFPSFQIEDHNLIADSHGFIHRKNIRLRGLPDLQDRALVDMFKELCTKKLGINLQETDIDMTQWAGPTQRDGTRPALITFSDFHTKKVVLEVRDRQATYCLLIRLN